MSWRTRTSRISLNRTQIYWSISSLESSTVPLGSYMMPRASRSMEDENTKWKREKGFIGHKGPRIERERH